MPLRTVLIHHIDSKLISNYYITQFVINTVLFLLLFFAPVKNSFTISYKTDPNVHPSPEPTTSIARFICWNWIDGLIWEAHRHIINKEDVWGLLMQDYSIFVVKSFRKFTKLPRYKTGNSRLIYCGTSDTISCYRGSGHVSQVCFRLLQL